MQKFLLDKKAGNLFSFSLLRALLSKKELDLIHLHTGKRMGGIGRYCAMKRNIPYIISLHGGNLAVPDDERETWVEPTKGKFEWGKYWGIGLDQEKFLTMQQQLSVLVKMSMMRCPFDILKNI